MTQFKDPSDQGRGIWAKFVVVRTDGQSEEGQFHHGCAYFPLDLTHDPHAIPAVLAYADSCERDNPNLAEDLRRIAQGGQRTCSQCGSTRVRARRTMGAEGLREDAITVHCRECGHHEYVV